MVSSNPDPGGGFAVRHFENFLCGDGEPLAIDVDTGRGTLLRRRKGDKPALECRYQLLGSLDTRANTWLWAWANEVSSFPQSLLRGVKAVRDQARKENKGVFLQAGPIPVPNAYFGSELSVICAGYRDGSYVKRAVTTALLTRGSP